MNQPPGPVECGLAAHASRRARAEELAGLRRQPGPTRGLSLPGNLLRHSDELTVISLAAVLAAADRSDLDPGGFADWGVVAAPRFIGRTSVAQALPRFVAEGSWGVSPHIIPHRSLHSTPGTISQALKLHGPNFGAGGGPGCEAEALLTGVTLLHEARLPGVWVVVSRLDPEGPVDPVTGESTPGTVAHAVAVALTPVSAATRAVLELTVCPGPGEPLTPALLEEILARPGAARAVEALGLIALRQAGPFAGPHAPSFCAADRSLAGGRP